MYNSIIDKITLLIQFLVNVFMSILMRLNNLLSKIFLMVRSNDIDKNNILIQILFGLSVFIITILLGIDTDTKTENDEKLYRKKYIMMVYSIIVLIFFYNNGRTNIDTLILSVLLIIFLNSIAGINTAYNLGSLEKELGVVNIFIYSFGGWFAKAKTYISIFLLIILYIYSKYGRFFTKSNKRGLNYLDETVMFIIIFIFFLYHIVKDIIDRFGYYEFEKLKNKLEAAITLDKKPEGKALKEYLGINKENIEFIEMLALILYVEDIDFMNRNKPTYSFLSVIRRKINNMNFKYLMLKKRNNLKNNLNNKITIIEKIKYIIQYLIKGTLKSFKKFYSKFSTLTKNLCKNLFRGFSTLQQQIVRNTIMHPYSYNYLFRRKYFIENYYIKFFLKAYKSRIIKDKKVKRRWLNYIRGKRHIENMKYEQRKLISYEIKIEMLIYYYKIILGNPKDTNELLMKIYSESAHSLESLSNKKIAFEKSEYKKHIIKEILGQQEIQN